MQELKSLKLITDEIDYLSLIVETSTSEWKIVYMKQLQFFSEARDMTLIIEMNKRMIRELVRQ